MKKTLFFLSLIAIIAQVNAQLSATYECSPLETGSTIPLTTSSMGHPAYEDAKLDFTIVNSGVGQGTWDVDVMHTEGSVFNVSAVCCGSSCRTGSHNSATLDAGGSSVVSVHFSIPTTATVGTTESFSVKITNSETSDEDFTVNVTLTLIGESITAATAVSLGNAFPNPASDNVTINYAVNGQSQLVVTDITGRQVMEKTLNGSGFINLNVEHLNKGVYLYGIRQDGKQQPMKKLIIK